jgi:hypothetical protein
MHNLLTSPDLYDSLHTEKIRCYGPVSHNLTGMPQDLLGEKFKLEGGDGCFD